jgi:hypothetical protein
VPLIRLIHKYASALNGFDLTRIAVGEVVLVTDYAAAMLAREGWAELVTSDLDIGNDSSKVRKAT